VVLRSLLSGTGRDGLRACPTFSLRQELSVASDGNSARFSAKELENFVLVPKQKFMLLSTDLRIHVFQ